MRSWKLWNDWKEVAHSRNSYRNWKKSNKLANTRDAEDGSTITRSVPFVHNASDLYLSPLQRSLNQSRARVFPVAKVSGVTSLTRTLSRRCCPLRTRSDGWEEILLQPFGRQCRASPRRRQRHLRRNWQKKKRRSTTRLPRTKFSSRRGSKPRRTPWMDCARNSRLRRSLKGSVQSGFKPKRRGVPGGAACYALLCMVLVLPFLGMSSDLHRWNRTPTASGRNLSSSTSEQREQGQIRTLTMQDSSRAWMDWLPRPTICSRTELRRPSSEMMISVFEKESSSDEYKNLVTKEANVVVANIDQYGPTTSKFLEPPAANGIAGFLFSEMHVQRYCTRETTRLGSDPARDFPQTWGPPSSTGPMAATLGAISWKDHFRVSTSAKTDAVTGEAGEKETDTSQASGNLERPRPEKRVSSRPASDVVASRVQ